MYVPSGFRQLVAVLPLAASFGWMVSSATTASASVITVTSTAGTTGGPGCTLRDAITAANDDVATGGCPAGSDADTINLAAGATYTLTEVDNVTTDNGTPLPNGLPLVTSEITINGNGATIARSSAVAMPAFLVLTPAFRLLDVADGGRLTLTRITLTNGTLPDIPVSQTGPEVGGGGIFNAGVLTLIDTTVTGNNTGNSPVYGDGNPDPNCAGWGAGIFNTGTLKLTQSLVSFNRAGGIPPPDLGSGCTGDGGGIYNAVAALLTLEETTIDSNAAGNNLGDPDGGHGGGVANLGTLTVTNSTFSGNDSTNFGGAIANGTSTTVATATVINSTFSSNRAGGGGAIASNGKLTVGDSTFVGNSATGGFGGGIGSDGAVTVTNSTFSGNSADIGGAISNNGNFTMTNSTFSANGAADAGGGAVFNNFGGTLTLTNSVIANSTNGGDCVNDSGTVSGSYNLIGDAANACGLTNAVNGNLLGVDPHLGPLQNNGGPTQTMALLPGSPAIDAGDPNGCTDAAGNVLATDQRGAPRSVPGDTRCDIGAYEATWPAWATITPTPTATFTSTATITPTVTATLVSTSTRTPIIHTVAVDVGSTSGVPGQQVTFGVSLQSLNADVAGLQNDIGFDASTPVAANADGSPACVANPAIGKEATAFAFVDCSGAPPEGCSWMRALVFSLTDQSPIPDGSLLYTCTVNISAHALPGDYALVNSGVIVAGPNGQELLADSANGSVNVVADPAAQSATGGASAPAAASGAGSGCSLTREPPPAGGGLVALALFVGLVGCRRARRGVRDRADPAPSAGAAHGL